MGSAIQPFIDNIEVEKMHEEDAADLIAAAKGGSASDQTGSIIDESLHESQSKISKNENNISTS